MQKGVITLLDVLGWKGIWQRRDGVDAINKLTGLVDRIQKNIQRTQEAYKQNSEGTTIVFPKIRVISISDTIAIVSEIEDNHENIYDAGEEPLQIAIRYQATVVARLIRYSILDGIPLRGAMSVGDFEAKNNILIGPAVDEVAEWYELCDWIGVIQTPSAYLLEDFWPWKESDGVLLSKGVSLYGEAPFVLYKAPTKMGMYLTRCINWPVTWFAPSFTIKKKGSTSGDPAPDLHLKDLKDVILKMGPISPSIWKKYENTLTFYNKSLAAYRNLSLASEFREQNESIRQYVRDPENNSDSRDMIDSDEASYTLN